MTLKSVPIKSILFGSQFKLVFLTGWAAWVAIGLVMILVSIVVPSALTVNSEAAQGIGDGFVACFIAIVFGGIISALFTVLGCGVLKLVGKLINIGDMSYEAEDI